MATLDDAERIKVFVSYSRTDKEFADDLVIGLQACGFEAYIDREDIAAGEDWAARLGGLIAAADTVVYVLSPDSLSSEHCAWEVGESLRLNKRLLPVVWRPIPDGAAPPELSRLNYIHFTGEGRSVVAGLGDLAAALRVDIEWIREHTRLGALAARWQARNRSSELVLRGSELAAARAWRDARSSSAPAITDLQSAFIKAGEDAKAAAEAARRRARAGLLTGVSVVAVLMTGLAGVAGLLAFRMNEARMEARDAEQRAFAAAAEAEKANLFLSAANLRLEADISLQAAPADDGYFQLGPGWFPVAADYSGAVVRVERVDEDGELRALGSGFVIEGGLLNPVFNGQALLVTPKITGGVVLSPAAPDDPAAFASALPGAALPNAVTFDPADGPAPDVLPADAPSVAQSILTTAETSGWLVPRISFPAVAPDVVIDAAEQVWSPPAHLGGVYPFEIWSLKDALPFGARAITAADVDCTPLGDGSAGSGGPSSPVAMYGVPPPVRSQATTPEAVRLFVGESLDRSDPYRIFYTHATSPGAMGAAVFDLSTRGIIAVHIGSEPDPDRAGRRRGFGLSFQLLLNIAREGASTRDAPADRLCEE
ncbi:TIR domain-containing protein [bacterium]|nr:TIR domain-containing protein [bacterium]